MAKVSMISLGCDKNRVDSEVMMAALVRAGHELVPSAQESEVVVINTCGFITPAKEESIEVILEATRLKEVKRQAVIVTGCLTQRYPHELSKELPEVDGFLGTGELLSLPSVLERVLAGQRVTAVDANRSYTQIEGAFHRVLSTPQHLAYLKIAEGCSNSCAYCAIPLIRGGYQSRPIEDIIEEARQLAGMGVRELILVAQDLTAYGRDRHGQRMLAPLLREVARVRGLSWVRLLYLYPSGINEELLTVIGEEDSLLNYFDIPLQHISASLLRRMGRRGDPARVRSLLEMIKIRFPDAALRTSLIVGLPGETDSDFQELVEFLKEFELDHVGVFRYSPEEGTPAATMADQVPEKLMEDRYHQLMTVQQGISRARNEMLVGTDIAVIIDEVIDERHYIGRGRRHAPEVDGQVYAEVPEGAAFQRPLVPGEIVPVQIVAAGEYDLWGEFHSSKSNSKV